MNCADSSTIFFITGIAIAEQEATDAPLPGRGNPQQRCFSSSP